VGVLELRLVKATAVVVWKFVDLMSKLRRLQLALNTHESRRKKRENEGQGGGKQDQEQ